MFDNDQLAPVLVAGITLLSLVVGQCPVKECYCNVVEILCENKGFTSLPASLVTQESNQTSLILDWNQIAAIPAKSLPPNLQEISWDGNPILTVEDTAFDASANTLQILSFRNARFTRIPDAFLHLHALTKLTIYETSITDWNTDAMKNIGQTLQTFYFTQAGLQAWPDCVQYFSHLTDLSVTFTSIATIPDDALSGMSTSLKSLALNNNSFTAVPKALSILTALERLFLGQNKIVDIGFLPAAAKLQILFLDGNRISDAKSVSNLLVKYADSLEGFMLSDNRLPSLPELSFCKVLTSFYFSNNLISDAYSGSLPPATYLVDFQNNLLTAVPSVYRNLTTVISFLLSSNIIRGLREGDIPQWIELIQLDQNFITQLTDTSFPVNSNLSSLTFDYNPISEITSSAFDNLQLLTGLSLRGSKLTRVPLALTSLTNLNDLDLTDSMNLVCTCVEKNLGPWMNRFEDYLVEGNCGTVSIYYFFTTLAPSCP